MQTKRCTKCGETKPLREFASHKGMADGHRPDCRACVSAYNKAYRAANLDRLKVARKAEYARDREKVLNERRKPCAWCGGVKPEGERRRYCDACVPLAEAEQRELDRQRTRAWATANPARKKAHDVRARAKPDYDERMKAAGRKWRAANPDVVAGGRRRWREQNPERWALLQARRRAFVLGAFVEDVHSLVVLERADGVCGICGGDVDPQNFHVDHIVPLSKGGEHSYRNTQPAHPRCNVRKGVKTP